MTTRLTLFCPTALIAGSLAPALAQDRPIDVRTGLWEFSTQQSMTGMPKMPAIPDSVLKNMPPAQRARLKAALKAQRGGTGKYVSTVCVTAAELRQGPTFGMRHEANCKRTQYQRTAHGHGRDITIKQTTHGRWLAADCGKVKPPD
ncbi:MAG: DUF3617 family protein [Pseudolabrys sp.]|jgi:hypothetical protein